MAKPKKLAVLGGGMGTLSALYWITSRPDWQEHYDITLYQIGFRLGGKGASGRNTREYNRIEEHGYHIIFGFYHNTLAMMKACYAELGRADNAPVSDFYADTSEDERVYPDRYAVKRVHAHTFYQEYPPADPKLRPMDFVLPMNNSLGNTHKKQSYIDVLQTIYDRLRTAYSAVYSDTETPVRTQPSWWSELEQFAPGIVLLMKTQIDNFLGIGGHLNAAGFLLKYLPQDEHILRQDYWDLYQFIARLVRNHIQELWGQLKGKVYTDADAYESWVRQDFFGTIFVGIIQDDLMEKGLDSINNKNFYEWFQDQAIVAAGSELTAESVMVAAMYNFGFCFRDGDGDSPPKPGSPMPGQPDIEAGVLLRILLRWMFDYEGSPYWFFQVSCADALFAPLYEVLQRRGVKFKFFHEITKLVAEDNRIVKIELARQADLKVDEYEPLILVKGVPCWPSEPQYSQIVHGHELERAIAGGMDIESPTGHWRAKGQAYPIQLPPLVYGEDFDEVLFGIPPGAFKGPMAESLAEQSAQWSDMAAHLEVIRTEALQIRLRKSIRELGWLQPYQLLAMVGVSDLNTFADMAQQLYWESWPRHADKPYLNPKSSFYFVSAMRSSVIDPDKHIREASIKFLNGYFIDIFPAAAAYRGEFRLEKMDDTQAAPEFPLPSFHGDIAGFKWNGRTLVYWSDDNTVYVWQPGLPTPQRNLSQDGPVRGAQWAKSGHWLVTWSSDGNAYLWSIAPLLAADAAHAGHVGPASPYAVLPHTGPVLGAAFSPNDSHILTWSDDGTACIWPMPVRNQPTPTPVIMRHNGPVLSAAWSPNGEYILTCCKDGAARLWKLVEIETRPPRPITTLEHAGPVLGGAWDPAKHRLLTWSEDHTACIWELLPGTNQPYRKFILPHRGAVTGGAWDNRNDSYVITWSDDKSVRIWHVPPLWVGTKTDTSTGTTTNERIYDGRRARQKLKPEYVMPQQGKILGAAWNPVNTSVLAWTDQTVNVWSPPYLAPHVISDTNLPGGAQWSAAGEQVMYALDKREFNWDLLVYDRETTPPDVLPIDTQYMNANVRPSDQYVLTVVGSSKYRLGAGETDFDNLTITGDWTNTTLNVGCMEAAAMAGMMASRAMTGYPEEIEGERDFNLIPMAQSSVLPLQNAALRTLDAGVDFYGQLAKAIAAGFEGFRDEVSAGNLSQRSLASLLISGTVKGGSQFASHLQQAVGELQKDLGPFLPQGFDPSNLDYTTLARLVSEEIRKQAGGRGRR